MVGFTCFGFTCFDFICCDFTCFDFTCYDFAAQAFTAPSPDIGSWHHLWHRPRTMISRECSIWTRAPFLALLYFNLLHLDLDSGRRYDFDNDPRSFGAGDYAVLRVLPRKSV